MSESGDQKKSPFGVVFIIFLLLVAVLGYGILNNIKKSGSDTTESAQTSNQDENASNISTDIANATAGNSTAAVVNNAEGFSLEAASKPRILGNPDAPVRISEHSSFTCGHCANFHKTNFKKIKADYVDTGKAYIIYNDFPLNGHDVNIGAVARCVPEKSYFQFIQLLFETQKDWLQEDYIKHVKQNAQLTGASAAQIEECLNSEDLFEALANQRQEAMDKHDVKATPTLVINDHLVIPGLSPYEDIKKALDAEYEKATK